MLLGGQVAGRSARMYAGGFERWDFFSSCCVDFATVAATVVEGALGSDGDLSRRGWAGDIIAYNYNFIF